MVLAEFWIQSVLGTVANRLLVLDISHYFSVSF